MATNLFHYSDYQTTRKHRRRIVVMLPDADVLRPDSPPEWGADSSGNFFRLASGAFTVPEATQPQAAYKDYIIGMAQTPIHALTINYQKLYRNHIGTPSTEAQELAAGLRNYTLPNGGSYEYGDSQTRTFDTAPVIWIYSDEGDSTLSIDEFTCRFRSTIRKAPVKEGDLTTGGGFSQTVELYDLGRAVLDSIMMEDVCLTMIENGYTNDEEYGQTVDTPWTATGGVDLRTQHGGTDALTGPRVRMYPLQQTFVILELQMILALQSWLRRDVTDLETVYASITSFQNEDGTSIGTAWDHWTRYQQLQTPTMSRGTALDLGDWNIIGEVMSAPEASDGVRVGGVLHPGTDEITLGKIGYSAWDFVSDCCNGGICKGKLLTPTDTRLTLRFNRPFESTTVRTITRTDMIRSDIDKPMVTPISEGFEVIGNVEVKVDGAEGDEQSSIKVRNFGSDNEDGGVSRTMFSSEPSIGVSDDWAHALSGADAFAYNPNSFPLRHLFYFGTVPGIAGDVPIRVHHSATIDLGNGVTWDDVGTVPVLPDGGFDDDGFAAWLATVRVTLAQTYYQSATAYTMCRLLIDLFGNPKITKYDLTLWGSLARQQDIGDEYRLSPLDGNGNYSASALGAVECDVTDLYGRCFLLSTKINEDLDTAEVELVGMGH